MATNRRYDPRLGDEDTSEVETKEARFEEPPSRPPSRKYVQLEPEPHREEKEEKVSILKRFFHAIPIDTQWMIDNWSWSKIKPVIRCALTGWVSIVLLLIPSVMRAMGQSAFFIVITALMDPASYPFIEMLEREIILLSLVLLAWGWSSLGIFLASLARSNIDRNAPRSAILSGQYIEAGPTIVLVVFIFVGSSFLLWLRARQGPGPFTVATSLSCLCVDSSITTAIIFPYPNYAISIAFVKPVAIHSGLVVLSSATIFPSTITAKYTACFGRTLEHLHTVLKLHREVLAMDPSSEEFKSTVHTIQGSVDKAEQALGTAGATNRLLRRDIVYGRFSPAGLAELQWWLRRLLTRSNGMGVYFTCIDPTREKFPITPMPSRPMTPADGNTPVLSRSGSPADDGRRQYTREEGASEHSPPRRTISRSSGRHFPGTGQRSSNHHDHRLPLALLNLAHSSLSRISTTAAPGEREPAVGIFESQRYLHLESTRLSANRSPKFTTLFTRLLHESCEELLENAQNGLKGVNEWVDGVRRGSFGHRSTVEMMRKAKLEHLETLHRNLEQAFERFRREKRLRVLDPYRSAFDPKHIGYSDSDEQPAPHKFLFDCYMYEYHLMELANILKGLLEEIIRLEKTYRRPRFWLPTIPLSKLLAWSKYDTTDSDENAEDEDPDTIPGLGPDEFTDLGVTQRRDPDALPPRNIFQLIMSWLYGWFGDLFRGNSLFALKAGILTILLILPSCLRSSGDFAYSNRFVWAIFIGQLTLSRWRGDTTFSLVSRVMSTTCGCAAGLAMWYLSKGPSDSNPYGLAAVCAVTFPAFYYFRLYWPGRPKTNTIFFVSIALVIGYSWQNTNFPSGPFQFSGWQLAWRRLVAVIAGVTAAFLFSFLPPSHTLRSYHRRTMTRTVVELGSVYCAIVSFANTRRQAVHDIDRDTIIKSLIAIRLKLKRSLVLKKNVVYEFSLRGKWPSERYQKLLEIQLQIAYLLSHLMSVVEHLEPAWARAFLRRTRFLDSDFQGDVLAVITLISTSLRTGTPLPQITPCPLLDRFMAHTHGLNIIREEADDDYGLPRTMTIDTLENEQYLRFSVGVTHAFSIVSRLDRLMMATKELVGEQHHIHGVGLPPQNYNDVSNSPRPAKDA